MKGSELSALLKRVVELVMPDLRSYYRVVRKARVVKTYASDGRYWADVQPLRNDENVDESEPVISKVEIPVVWAGPERGIVCPPVAGAFCDLEYYDGDPDYPRISNFRWHGNKAPGCELGAFIIQQSPEVYVKITPGGDIVHKTTGERVNEIGGGKQETVVADWNIEVGGSALIEAGAEVTVRAPQINLVGPLLITGVGGGHGSGALQGDLNVIGNITVTGDITATGTIIDGGGNTNHHEHAL